MNFETEELIFRYLRNECSEQERTIVSRWIDESPMNRREFEAIDDIVRGSALMKGVDAIDENAAWERVRAATAVVRRKNAGRRLSRRVMRYTAAVLVPLCLVAGGYFVFRTMTPASLSEITAGITPGNNSVILTLSDGSEVALSGVDRSGFSDAGHSIEIIADGSTINYAIPEGVEGAWEAIINKITVPRGCRHNVRLSDGTRVWLNSESVLEYPVAFGGGGREVKLWGEAWFEVAPNDGRKFTVVLESGAIEVTGTSFNVSSYPGDTFNRTVLATGSVDFITPAGEVTHLGVGESALFDIGAGDVTVEQVDVEHYSSWKDGICHFRNAPLREIATTLSRLYDVEFEFADPDIEQMRFSGAVLRDKPISLILELLEQTNSIKFSLADTRKLTVDNN